MEITILFLLITGNTHPNHLGLYWSIFPNPVPEKIMSYFTSYKQQEFLLLLNLYWFYQADTASSPRCYCSISRINNRRFSSQNNPPAWTIHSLKSIHSHSTLSHWYLPLGRYICATATPVRSSAKASAILNESLTAGTASRFSPVTMLRPWRPRESTRSPFGGRVSEKNAPSVWLQWEPCSDRRALHQFVGKSATFVSLSGVPIVLFYIFP